MILLTEGLADEFFRLVIWSDLSEEGSSSFTEEEDLEGSISATDLLAAFDDFDGIDGSDEGLMMFCLVFSDATSFRSKIQRTQLNVASPIRRHIRPSTTVQSYRCHITCNGAIVWWR